MREILIEVKNLSKVFKNGKRQTSVLKEVNLKIEKGEILAITGKSGSGKSTLLSILAGLDKPTSGRIEYLGQDLYQKPDKELDNFRANNIGIIFQNYNLVNELNCRQNIELPAIFAKKKELDSRRIDNILKEIGLWEKANLFPSQMSGGEQQRAAVARAIINEPYIVFADEPTGALDTQNTETIMAILKSIRKIHSTAIVIVTHDKDIANQCDRKLVLTDGRLE